MFMRALYACVLSTLASMSTSHNLEPGRAQYIAGTLIPDAW